MQRKRLGEKRVEVAVPCSCQRPSGSRPLVRLVLVLQMQHHRGIHTYREEASRFELLDPRGATKTREWGSASAANRRGLISSLPPTPAYIGVPNGLSIPRSIRTLKPDLTGIQSELGF